MKKPLMEVALNDGCKMSADFLNLMIFSPESNKRADVEQFICGAEAAEYVPCCRCLCGCCLVDYAGHLGDDPGIKPS